jgi:glycine cleavage system aminomethyltransferase T
MTTTVGQSNWSPLQEFAPPTTVTAEIGSATVPWTYGQAEAEYLTLRSTAGKLDLAGAALIEATGPDAYDLLQYALARDLEFVTPEQSLISLLLDQDGGAIDVVNAYHTEDGFRLETAVGRGPDTLAHLEKLSQARDLDVTLTHRADLTLILVEGPQAAKVLEQYIDPDLGSLPLSGLMEVPFAGAEVLVSRTGFTGEFGYKLIVATPKAPAVWSALETITPVGHAALEVAMFEVRQPLLHRELTRGAGALEAGYAWLIDITKEEFHGREAVLEAFDSGVRSDTVGFVAAGVREPFGIGTPVTIEEQEVGVVLHSVLSPSLDCVIGLARMRPGLVAPTLGISVAGADAVTASTPYVIPLSWSVR